MSHKKVPIIYDMVNLDVFRFRNVKRDTEAIGMAAEIADQTGRDDGAFVLYYAQRILYTDAMHFHWDDDVPDEIKNLETWWEKVDNGGSAAEAYLYYIDNIPNWVANEWQQAIKNSHRIWKPLEEEMPPDEEDGDDIDPN